MSCRLPIFSNNGNHTHAQCLQRDRERAHAPPAAMGTAPSTLSPINSPLRVSLAR